MSKHRRIRFESLTERRLMAADAGADTAEDVVLGTAFVIESRGSEGQRSDPPTERERLLKNLNHRTSVWSPETNHQLTRLPDEYERLLVPLSEIPLAGEIAGPPTVHPPDGLNRMDEEGNWFFYDATRGLRYRILPTPEQTFVSNDHQAEKQILRRINGARYMQPPLTEIPGGFHEWVRPLSEIPVSDVDYNRSLDISSDKITRTDEDGNLWVYDPAEDLRYFVNPQDQESNFPKNSVTVHDSSFSGVVQVSPEAYIQVYAPVVGSWDLEIRSDDPKVDSLIVRVYDQDLNVVQAGRVDQLRETGLIEAGTLDYFIISLEGASEPLQVEFFLRLTSTGLEDV